jgi:hypothetical protein
MLEEFSGSRPSRIPRTRTALADSGSAPAPSVPSGTNWLVVCRDGRRCSGADALRQAEQNDETRGKQAALPYSRSQTGKGTTRKRSCRYRDCPRDPKPSPVVARKLCSRGASPRAACDQGIATANPIFTWVRLAQRIPLRIVLEAVAEGVVLVAGMTATVEVHARVRSCSASLSLGAIRVTRRAAAPAEGDLLRPAPRTRTPPR